MVLFYEDDERLKPPKKPPTKLRRRVRLAVRVLLGFTVFLGISLAAMNMMGGSGDGLRSGAQDYLSRITGLDAEIGTLEKITFFPEFSTSMKDVSFRRGKDGAEAARIAAMDFSMGFWDVFFRRGRIRVLEVTGAHIDAGVVSARPVDIGRAGIDLGVKDKDAAQISASGSYGGESFHISMDLESRDIGGGRRDFRRPPQSKVSLSLPFLTVDGVLSRARGGGLQLDMNAVGLPEKAFEGKALLRKTKGKTALSLELTAAAGADAGAGQEKLKAAYCALAVAGQPPVPGLSLEKFTIGGVAASLPWDCGAAANP